jgi:hypothetical protein
MRGCRGRYRRCNSLAVLGLRADTRWMNGRRRGVLAAAWVGFLFAWVGVVVLALGITGLGPCGGDGGSPYAAPASPAGRYCTAWDRYFDSGEPGELTTALVWLWPVAALAAIGCIGVWKRRTRVLVAVAVVVLLLPLIHVALAFSLNNRCSPDDPTMPGCHHY